MYFKQFFIQDFLLDVAKLDPKQYDIQKGKKKNHMLVSIHKIKNLNIFPKKKNLENYPFHPINEKKGSEIWANWL